MSQVTGSRFPALSELFLGFMGTSLSGFGGVLPWARRTLVEQRRWLTPASGYLITLSADHSIAAFAITIITVMVVMMTRIHPLWLIAAAGLAGLAGFV